METKIKHNGEGLQSHLYMKEQIVSNKISKRQDMDWKTSYNTKYQL